MIVRGQEETLAEEISEGEALTTVVGEEKCIKPFAVIAERIVKFLLGQMAVSPFIAVSVLKKWAAEPIQEGFKTGAQEGPILKEETIQAHKTMNSLR